MKVSSEPPAAADENYIYITEALPVSESEVQDVWWNRPLVDKPKYICDFERQNKIFVFRAGNEFLFIGKETFPTRVKRLEVVKIVKRELTPIQAAALAISATTRAVAESWFWYCNHAEGDYDFVDRLVTSLAKLCDDIKEGETCKSMEKFLGGQGDEVKKLRGVIQQQAHMLIKVLRIAADVPDEVKSSRDLMARVAEAQAMARQVLKSSKAKMQSFGIRFERSKRK
jgi:hypothetical protein